MKSNRWQLNLYRKLHRIESHKIYGRAIRHSMNSMKEYIED